MFIASVGVTGCTNLTVQSFSMMCKQIGKIIFFAMEDPELPEYLTRHIPRVSCCLPILRTRLRKLVCDFMERSGRNSPSHSSVLGAMSFHIYWVSVGYWVSLHCWERYVTINISQRSFSFIQIVHCPKLYHM